MSFQIHHKDTKMLINTQSLCLCGQANSERLVGVRGLLMRLKPLLRTVQMIKPV